MVGGGVGGAWRSVAVSRAAAASFLLHTFCLSSGKVSARLPFHAHDERRLEDGHVLHRLGGARARALPQRAAPLFLARAARHDRSVGGERTKETRSEREERTNEAEETESAGGTEERTNERTNQAEEREASPSRSRVLCECVSGGGSVVPSSPGRRCRCAPPRVASVASGLGSTATTDDDAAGFISSRDGDARRRRRW